GGAEAQGRPGLRQQRRQQAAHAFLAAGRARPGLRRRRAPRRERLAGRAAQPRAACGRARGGWGPPPPAPPRRGGRRRRGTYTEPTPQDASVLKADTIRVNSGSTVKDVSEYLAVPVP